MSFSPSLKNEQTLGTVLSQNMQQSLKILQMSQQELRQSIYEEIEKNPLLEIDHEKEVSVATEEMEFAQYYRSSFDRREGDDYLAYDHSISEKSFAELLTEQLQERNLSSELMAICEFLILCLDDRGYLRDDIRELAEIMNVSETAVLKGISVIQTLEPVGVGATSLEECLLLQLRYSGNDTPDTELLVKEGLELLANNQMTKITKLLGGNQKKAQAACAVVRGLNPIPTRGYFTGEQNAYTVPDAFIDWVEGQFVIRLYRMYPQIKLNETYHSLLSEDLDRESEDLDRESIEYIRDHTQRANAILRSIQDRERTVQRLLELIVSRQQAFFRDGGQLSPMTMSELAQELELDVSTVSRAVQGKYVICCKGAVALRSLFTSSYMSEDGRNLSADYVRKRIKKIIENEDPRAPLSDEKIRELLRKEHIPISRRAVTKHREKIGIASSGQRRRG